MLTHACGKMPDCFVVSNSVNNCIINRIHVIDNIHYNFGKLWLVVIFVKFEVLMSKGELLPTPVILHVVIIRVCGQHQKGMRRNSMFPSR